MVTAAGRPVLAAETAALPRADTATRRAVTAAGGNRMRFDLLAPLAPATGSRGFAMRRWTVA